MKNKNVQNYLTIVGILLVTLGLLFGSYFLFKPIKDKNIMKQEIKQYSTILNNIDTIEELEIDANLTSIINKYLAKDKNNKELATLYKVSKKNVYGSITIIVAVNEKGEILGIDVANIDQSKGSDTTINYIKSLKGSTILNPESQVDITGVTVSNATVLEMLEEVKKSHDVVEDEKSIYEQLFGENYELEAEEITPTDVVLTKQSVKVDGETKAYVYTIKKFGIYQDENDEKLPIQLDVILDLENNIIGFDHQDENYKHSGGPFKRAVLSYLDAIAKEKLSIHNVSEFNPDITNGTNSRTLVKSMLVDLDNFIKGGN